MSGKIKTEIPRDKCTPANQVKTEMKTITAVTTGRITIQKKIGAVRKKPQIQICRVVQLGIQQRQAEIPEGQIIIQTGQGLKKTRKDIISTKTIQDINPTGTIREAINTGRLTTGQTTRKNIIHPKDIITITTTIGTKIGKATVGTTIAGRIITDITIHTHTVTTSITITTIIMGT